MTTNPTRADDGSDHGGFGVWPSDESTVEIINNHIETIKEKSEIALLGRDWDVPSRRYSSSASAPLLRFDTIDAIFRRLKRTKSSGTKA